MPVQQYIVRTGGRIRAKSGEHTAARAGCQSHGPCRAWNSQGRSMALHVTVGVCLYICVCHVCVPNSLGSDLVSLFHLSCPIRKVR